MTKLNNSTKSLRKKTSSLSILGICLLCVFSIALITIVVLEATNTIHLLHKSVPTTEIVVKVGKPTSKPVNNVSTNTNTSKTLATNSPRAVGTATDTNGNAATSTDSSQWIISTSGNITVKQPLANTKLSSGAILSGSAKVSSINFRLIDDKVGVISEGTLNVTNGSFSGTLSFSPQSNSGRLDIFTTASNGAELNEIQITVSF